MTTPNMNLTEPTDHGSSSVWGSLLNSTLDLIDAHDHTTGNGVKIPSAALNINADVSWSSSGMNYAITDVRALDFTQVASSTVTALADALYVDSNDSNLYFRNHTGTNVQITSGTTLNVSIVGGIGGDYASISALLDYDDASDTYRFRQQVSSAVRQFAKISSADVNLFEYKAAGNATVPTNAVTLKSPSALAGSYTLTMPAALQASTMALTGTSAGVLAFGASFGMQSNANITLSGTGTYKHGTKTVTRPIYGNNVYFSAGSASALTPPGLTLAASSTCYVPVFYDLPTHARILNVRLYYALVADAAACTAKLYSTSDTAPIATGFTDLTATMTPGGTSIATYNGINYQHTAGGGLWIQVTNTTGGEHISAIAYDYDVP